MQTEELQNVCTILQLSINNNLRAIRLLYDNLQSADQLSPSVGRSPAERVHYKIIQVLMDGNEQLFAQLEKLMSLLPDKDAGIFIKPLKESHDRFVKKMELYALFV
jgi:hypothetical protein